MRRRGDQSGCCQEICVSRVNVFRRKRSWVTKQRGSTDVIRSWVTKAEVRRSIQALPGDQRVASERLSLCARFEVTDGRPYRGRAGHASLSQPYYKRMLEAIKADRECPWRYCI